MKIGMFSFADIDNYGDILFSHIFKMEMESRMPEVQIDFFTPSEIEIEGMYYKGYSREKVDGKYDALILAGGEVVHLFDERTWKPIYEKRGQEITSGLASNVVWDWLNCDCGFKGWLSIGVRPFGDKWDEEKIKKAIYSLDYIATRGILSKKILEGNNNEVFDPKIVITPDLGWIFPKYLGYRGEVGLHYRNWVRDGEKYAIFQVHNINEDEAFIIGKALLEFQSKTGITVLLMPVIHLWQDEDFLNMVSRSVGNQFLVLPNNLTILEMADLIVHSEIVLCSSLHVAITALAKGIPAAVFNKWQGSKLQDLFGLQFRTQYLFSDLNLLDDILGNLLIERSDNAALVAYADFMQIKLKETFDNLSDKINKSSKNFS